MQSKLEVVALFETRSLATLIESVALGDSSAFAELFERTAAKVRKTCASIYRNEAAVEDLMQETYLKIWLKAEHFDASDGSAIAWIAKIAKHTAIDAVRRETRRPFTYIDDTSYIPDERPNPEHIAVNDCFMKNIDAQITSLPEPFRETIVAVFREEITYDRYAADRNTPIGTVKSRIRRGLSKVRTSMIAITA